MSITELFKHVGDENIEFQNILHSSPTINQGKNGATILFHTGKDKGQAMMNGALDVESDYVGLVVWLPKNKLPC